MKPWEMLSMRRFEDARRAYAEQLEKSPEDPDLLAAHSLSLLGLGRFEESLLGFRSANELASRRIRGASQPYLEKVGGILWILRRRVESIDTFREGVDLISSRTVTFTDNAGGVDPGVLFWYASSSAADHRSHEHSVRYLSALATTFRHPEWPAPLALLVLGKSSLSDVLADLCGVSDPSDAVRSTRLDILKSRRLVRALFYGSVIERNHGRHAGFRHLLELCAKIENPVLEIEWYLAQSELLDAGSRVSP
jgi:hypothetical protein